MSKTPPRRLRVIRSKIVTPHMLRLTLGGPELSGFPADSNSAYIKLKMTEPPPDCEKRPIIRTYTVRDYNADKLELDVDFVLHEDQGPASGWAKTAQPGDEMTILGPGPKKLVDYAADWFLLVGDMSALPAISANIEGMPADAKGYVFLEVIDDADKQDLAFPADIEVHWIINPHPDKPNNLLLDVVRRAPFVPSGSFTTCTSTSAPSLMSSRISGSGCSSSPLLTGARRTISETCRNAVRSRPISTNAACMPGSTRHTLPL